MHGCLKIRRRLRTLVEGRPPPGTLGCFCRRHSRGGLRFRRRYGFFWSWGRYSLRRFRGRLRIHSGGTLELWIVPYTGFDTLFGVGMASVAIIRRGRGLRSLTSGRIGHMEFCTLNRCAGNGILLLQYNLVGTLGSQPGVSSVSCQSYNKRSNWLTIPSLGRKVRF